MVIWLDILLDIWLDNEGDMGGVVGCNVDGFIVIDVGTFAGDIVGVSDGVFVMWMDWDVGYCTVIYWWSVCGVLDSVFDFILLGKLLDLWLHIMKVRYRWFHVIDVGVFESYIVGVSHGVSVGWMDCDEWYYDGDIDRVWIVFSKR